MDFAPLFAAIVADFVKWNKPRDGKISDYQLQSMADFKEYMDVDVGKKYIRIVIDHNRPGARVWGFVVNTHDDPKFKYGDVLKAAGWKTPAKNKARGSVFDTDFSWVRWTSAI